MDPAEPTTEPWTESDTSGPLPLAASLRDDLAAYVAEGAWGGPLGVILTAPGFHAGLLYRLGHLARHRGGRIGRVASGAIFWWTRHAYFCSIASTARLHGGLVLPEPLGIVIGPGSVVGPGGRIEASVTLGGIPGKLGMPWLGAGVQVGRGAVLSGAVVVGDRAGIGPLVVLWVNVPAGATVRSPSGETRGKPVGDGSTEPPKVATS